MTSRYSLPTYSAAATMPDRLDDAADSLGDALLCAADLAGFQAEGGVQERDGEAFGVVTCGLNGVEWVLTLPSALAVSARLIFNRAPSIAARQRLNFARKQLAEAMRASASLVLANRRRGVH